MHGEMGADGHRQFNAVSDVNGVAAVSPQVAFTTKGSKVESEINHPSPPHPTAVPQLKGSENKENKLKMRLIQFWCAKFLLSAAETNELVKPPVLKTVRMDSNTVRSRKDSRLPSSTI